MTKVIGGSSCKKIAYDLSVNLNVDYIDATVARFADQELRIQLPSSLREEDVIIVQSTCKPANDHLMELLLLIDAVRCAGSRRVIAIIPYFGYSRQDRHSYKGGPISARLVANMLEAAGVDHIITLDLHSNKLEEFFKINIHNIDPTPLFASYLRKADSVVVVSPDIGSLIRAKKLAHILQSDFAMINKTRKDGNSCEMKTIIGDVVDKDCVIIDDILDTGETMHKAALFLKQYGAKSVQMVVTHAVLSKDAKQKLNKAPIDTLITTNSIPQELNQEKSTVLDVVPIISQAVKMLMLNSCEA